ncbi:hypothetical protein CC117_00755 [Parafrankia colletiae]|uniref:Uncharacterized protein n=1 Tax=Parafrankia colletiae TaxID=573497 RepID=A0A1S1RK95_9ACTN|nr:hypothetical protein [Parafrankia colletiae]MCK9904274.1 hypothetical protein [Frankia sp. Cpl3]OHV46219.1 hypothetical protein CC117_00755 [Parafrankia colletiae]
MTRHRRGARARYDLGDGEFLDVEVLRLARDGESDSTGITAPDENSLDEPHYWLRGKGFAPFLGAESEISYAQADRGRKTRRRIA